MLIIATGFGSDIFLLESSDRGFPDLKWPRGRVLAKRKKKSKPGFTFSGHQLFNDFRSRIQADFEHSRTILAFLTST